MAKFSETKTTQVDVIEVEILVVFLFCFFFHLLWFKPWIKQLANLLSTEKYYNVVSPLTFCGNIFDVALFFFLVELSLSQIAVENHLRVKWS